MRQVHRDRRHLVGSHLGLEVGHDLVVRPATGVYLHNIEEQVKRLGISELCFTSNRITYSLYDRLRELLDVEILELVLFDLRVEADRHRGRHLRGHWGGILRIGHLRPALHFASHQTGSLTSPAKF